MFLDRGNRSMPSRWNAETWFLRWYQFHHWSCVWWQ